MSKSAKNIVIAILSVLMAVCLTLGLTLYFRQSPIALASADPSAQTLVTTEDDFTYSTVNGYTVITGFTNTFEEKYLSSGTDAYNVRLEIPEILKKAHGAIPANTKVDYVQDGAFNGSYKENSGKITFRITDVHTPESVYWQSKSTKNEGYFDLANYDDTPFLSNTVVENSSDKNYITWVKMLGANDGNTATVYNIAENLPANFIVPSPMWYDNDNDGKMDSDELFANVELLVDETVTSQNSPNFKNMVISSGVTRFFSPLAKDKRIKLEDTFRSSDGSAANLTGMHFATGRTTVLSIYGLAFQRFTNLKTITLSAGVLLADGVRAFQGDTGVEQLTIAKENNSNVPSFYVEGDNGAIYTDDYRYDYYDTAGYRKYLVWDYATRYGKKLGDDAFWNNMENWDGQKPDVTAPSTVSLASNAEPSPDSGIATIAVNDIAISDADAVLWFDELNNKKAIGQLSSKNGIVLLNYEIELGELSSTPKYEGHSGYKIDNGTNRITLTVNADIELYAVAYGDTFKLNSTGTTLGNVDSTNPNIYVFTSGTEPYVLKPGSYNIERGSSSSRLIALLVKIHSKDGITASPSSVKINKGKTAEITVTATGTAATELGTIPDQVGALEIEGAEHVSIKKEYNTSKSYTVTLTANTVGKDTLTITLTTDGGTARSPYTTQVEVEVVDPDVPTALRLNRTRTVIEKGRATEFTAELVFGNSTTVPANLLEMLGNVEWKIEDGSAETKNWLSTDKGRVTVLTAAEKGSYTLTATYNDLSAKCEVNVVDGVDRKLTDYPQPQFTVHDQFVAYQKLIYVPPQLKGADGEPLKEFTFDYAATTIIGNSSFTATNIQVIIIPDRIAEIEEYAFRYSNALRVVYLPSNATYGNAVFGEFKDWRPGTASGEQDATNMDFSHDSFLTGYKNKDFLLIAPSRQAYDSLLQSTGTDESSIDQTDIVDTKGLSGERGALFRRVANTMTSGISDGADGTIGIFYDYRPALTYEVEMVIGDKSITVLYNQMDGDNLYVKNGHDYENKTWDKILTESGLSDQSFYYDSVKIDQSSIKDFITGNSDNENIYFTGTYDSIGVFTNTDTTSVDAWKKSVETRPTKYTTTDYTTNTNRLPASITLVKDSSSEPSYSTDVAMPTFQPIGEQVPDGEKEYPEITVMFDFAGYPYSRIFEGYDANRMTADYTYTGIGGHNVNGGKNKSTEKATDPYDAGKYTITLTVNGGLHWSGTYNGLPIAENTSSGAVATAAADSESYTFILNIQKRDVPVPGNQQVLYTEATGAEVNVFENNAYYKVVKYSQMIKESEQIGDMGVLDASGKIHPYQRGSYWVALELVDDYNLQWVAQGNAVVTESNEEYFKEIGENIETKNTEDKFVTCMLVISDEPQIEMPSWTTDNSIGHAYESTFTAEYRLQGYDFIDIFYGYQSNSMRAEITAYTPAGGEAATALPNSILNAGEYTVIFQPAPGYSWADGTSGCGQEMTDKNQQLIVTVTITKKILETPRQQTQFITEGKEIEFVPASDNTWTVNGYGAKDAEISSGKTTTLPKNAEGKYEAGTYQVKVQLTNSQNYAWRTPVEGDDKYAIAELIVRDINSLTIEVPTNKEGTKATYTGSDLPSANYIDYDTSLSRAVSKFTYETYKDGAYGTETATANPATIKDAGNYQITFTLPGPVSGQSYKWSDEKGGDTRTVELTVEKQEITNVRANATIDVKLNNGVARLPNGYLNPELYTVTYAHNGEEIGTPNKEGVYTVTLELTSAAYRNYYFSGTTRNIEGKYYPAKITLTLNVGLTSVTAPSSIDDYTYDGTSHSFDDALNIPEESKGFIVGKTYSTVTYHKFGATDTETPTQILNAGVYEFTFTLTNSIDYAWNIATDNTSAKVNEDGNLVVTITVNQAPLNITLTAANKDYDGTNTAKVTGTIGSGKIGDDNVTVGAITAHFEDANAGENKTVNVDPITLGGDKAYNYTAIYSETLTATISALDIEITWENVENLVYNGKDQAPTPKLPTTGIPAVDKDNADKLTVTVTGAHKDAGTQYTATAELGGTAAKNYNITGGGTQTYAIKQATITLPTLHSVTYDGTEQKATALATLSGENGETLTLGTDYTVNYAAEGYSGTTATNAGEYTVTVTLTSANALKNYTIGSGATAKFTIDKAKITFDKSTVSLTKEKTYDGNTSVTGVSADGEEIDIETHVNSETVKGKYTAVYNSKNVNSANTITVKLTLQNAANYEFGESSDSSYTLNEDGSITWTINDVKITPKTLDVAFDSDSLTQTYKGSALTPTATATGVNGEEVILDMTLSGGAGYTGTLTGTQAINAGTYGATATINAALSAENASTNYTLNSATTTKTFTIAKADLTVAVSDNSKTYNGEDQYATVTVTGVKGALEVGDYTVTYKLNGEGADVAEPTNAGTYYIYVTLTDENATNYNTVTVSDRLIISAATITEIEWYESSTSAVKLNTAPVYDGIEHTVKAKGKAGSAPDVELTVQNNTYKDVQAGGYKFTAELDGSGNYQFGTTAIIFTLTVSPKGITVTFTDNITKTYDNTTALPANIKDIADLEGVLTGDKGSVSIDSIIGAYTSKNVDCTEVSITEVTLTGKCASNYVVNQFNHNAQITQAQITVSGTLNLNGLDSALKEELEKYLTYNGKIKTIAITNSPLSQVPKVKEGTNEALSGQFVDKNGGVGMGGSAPYFYLPLTSLEQYGMKISNFYGIDYDDNKSDGAIITFMFATNSVNAGTYTFVGGGSENNLYAEANIADTSPNEVKKNYEGSSGARGEGWSNHAWTYADFSGLTEAEITISKLKVTLVWKHDIKDAKPIEEYKDVHEYKGSSYYAEFAATFTSGSGDTVNFKSSGSYKITKNGSEVNEITDVGTYIIEAVCNESTFTNHIIDSASTKLTVEITPYEITQDELEKLVSGAWENTSSGNVLASGKYDIGEAGSSNIVDATNAFAWFRDGKDAVVKLTVDSFSISLSGNEILAFTAGNYSGNQQEDGQYEYEATVVLTLANGNFKWAESYNAEGMNHKAADIADNALTLTKAWYLVKLENGVENGIEFTVDKAPEGYNWAFGQEVKIEEPTLMNTGAATGSYYTLTLTGLRDGRAIPAGVTAKWEEITYGDSSISNYLNAATPAGDYLLVLHISEYSDAITGKSYPAVDIGYSIRVANATITGSATIAAPGYEYDGNVKLPDDSAFNSLLELVNPERQGIWAAETYDPYYDVSADNITFSVDGSSYYTRDVFTQKNSDGTPHISGVPQNVILKEELKGDKYEFKEQPYTVHYSFKAANYAAVVGTFKVTVNRKAITMKLVSNKDGVVVDDDGNVTWEFGTSVQRGDLSFSYTTLVGSDKVVMRYKYYSDSSFTSPISGLDGSTDGNFSVPTQAGTYYVRFTFDHWNTEANKNNNYTIKNPNGYLDETIDGKTYSKPYYKITLTINRANATVSVSNISKTYSGSNQFATVTVKGVSGNLVNSDYTVTYLDSANTAVSPKNVGVYKVQVNLKGLAATNYNIIGYDTPEEFEITPAKVTVQYTGVTSFVYNGDDWWKEISSKFEANVINSAAGLPEITYTVLCNGAPVQNNEIIEVGTYSITASIADSNYELNLANGNEIVTISITGNVIERIEWIGDTTHTYNGSNFTQPAAYAILVSGAREELTVNGKVGSAVGSYEFSVVKTADYIFGDGLQLSFTVTVKPAQVSIAKAVFREVYTGKAHAPEITLKWDDDNLDKSYYTVSGPANAVNAGTYRYTVKLTNSNFTFAFGNNTTTATLYISAARVNIAQTEYTEVYSGEAKTLPQLGLSWNGGALTSNDYTISGTQAINAGTYTYKVTLKSKNFTFAGGNSAKVAMVITKLGVQKPAESTVEYTYNGQEQTYDVAENKYYSVSNATRTNAGTQNVYISLADKRNTVWADGTTKDVVYVFTVAKAEVTLNVEDAEFTYDGNGHGVTATASVEGLPVVITYNGYAVDPVSAGTYQVVASVPETGNYLGVTVSGKTLVINKKVVTASWNSTTSYEQNGAAQTPFAGIEGVPANVVKVTYRKGDVILGGAPIVAGSYTITVEILNQNYEFGGENVKTFTIAESSQQTNPGTPGNPDVNEPGEPAENGFNWDVVWYVMMALSAACLIFAIVSVVIWLRRNRA